MTKQKLDIGIVGLGVMGRNLVLNIADHGFGAAGYDKDKSKVDMLREEAEDRPVGAADNVADFIDLLKTPRAVMMLVPAGPPVDSVIHDLLPHLQAGDLVIDGGNSHFPDTDLRAKTLAEKGILYLGVGISGGAEGARRGPSIMPGCAIFWRLPPPRWTVSHASPTWGRVQPATTSKWFTMASNTG